MATLDPRLTARMGKWFSDKVGAPAQRPPASTGPVDSTTTGLLSDPAPSNAPSATSAWSGATAPSATAAVAPSTSAPTNSRTTTTDNPVSRPENPGVPAVNTPGHPAARSGTPVPNTGTAEERAARAALTNAQQPKPNSGKVALLEDEDLTQRVANPEATVEDRITGMLGESEYIDGFRERAKREANARGLVNSTMAVSAGEEAAAAGALPIASQDASYFGSIDEYNTALKNQAAMFNADAKNTYTLAELQSSTQRQIALASQAAQIASAEISAATSRYNAQIAANAQQYGNDTQARIAADNRAAQELESERNRAAELERQNSGNHDALVNNILNNNEIPPERRADLLRNLGENELANGIYVVDSTKPDLTSGGSPTSGPDNSGG